MGQVKAAAGQPPQACAARALLATARYSRALCAALLFLLLIGTPMFSATRARPQRASGPADAAALAGAAGEERILVVTTALRGAAAAPAAVLPRDASGVVVGTSRVVAPSARPLPPSCRVRVGFHIEEERDCYLALEQDYLADVAQDPTKPFCWGAGNATAGAAPSVFHTVSLSGLPSAFPLLVDSFLATQCCDAELWVWVDGGVLAAARAAGSLPPVPPGLASRVVYRALDVDALFESVRGDFPDVNSTAAAAMKDFADIRFRANWARILVLYIYGGVYVDLDTMFLHDYRPLLALPGPFTYRQGR